MVDLLQVLDGQCDDFLRDVCLAQARLIGHEKTPCRVRVAVQAAECMLSRRPLKIAQRWCSAGPDALSHGWTSSIERLLQRVWEPDKGEDSGPVRNIVKRLRRKLGDDASNPDYIFAEPRFGYRMPEGEEEAKP